MVEPRAADDTPSPSYCLVWQAMQDRYQITCLYDGLQREICPIILGCAEDGREVVFAYQFGGKTSPGRKLPGWRCLYLAEVGSLRSRPGRWQEGESHKQTQSCVKSIDIDVNVPDTLARKQPLPFGSPELRPPRRTEEK